MYIINTKITTFTTYYVKEEYIIILQYTVVIKIFGKI